MKQGLDQFMNFQLFLIGAGSTGKTSLVSSFLREEFVEGQSATKGADIEVCKLHCKEWVIHCSGSELIMENIAFIRMADSDPFFTVKFTHLYISPFSG